MIPSRTMETIKDRFYAVMEKLGLNDYKVYTTIPSITKNMMSKLRTGETGEVSTKIIAPFCSYYENANPEYILTGRGTPLKEENALSETINIPASNGIAVTSEKEYKEAMEKGFHLLPEVTFKFAAGQAELISKTEDITRYWYLPECKDCEGVAQIVGNSMTPALPAGCWVALKKYTLPRNNPNAIPFGNIFGVVVEDEITGDYHGHIKVIRRYKDQEVSRKYWIAHSINEKEFDDFDIEIAQVRSLWIVKQHIVSDILL